MTTGLRDWVRAHPMSIDAGIAVVVFALSLLAVPATPDMSRGVPQQLTVAVVCSLVVSCGALLFRRRHPTVAWAVSLGSTLVPLPDAELGRGLPAAVVALYAVAAYRSRRRAVVAAAVTMAAALFLVSRTDVVAANDPVSYAVVAWCAMAAALGDAVRSNRQVLAAALDRARRAEQSREEEAQRRVTQERLRISRELHDVVAHQIAVVNVQAGVAEHLATSDPDKAVAALRQVRAASSEALAELGELVGLLRAEGEGGSGLEPTPGVADLPRLVNSVRAAGREVVWRHRGQALQVPTTLELHLFRIVQEALTNAARHGVGAIDLVTRQEDDAIVVEVSNRIETGGPDAAAPGHHTRTGGHGLLGMRERVALTGGELRAGPVGDDRFVVHVSIPATQPTPKEAW